MKKLNEEQLYHLIDLVELHTMKIKRGDIMPGFTKGMADKAYKFDAKLIKKLRGML